jgi:hypothetical protein
MAVSPSPSSRPSGSELPAKVGLALAVLLALLGVVSAVAKSASDDDDRSTGPAPTHQTTTTAEALVVPDGFRVLQGDGVYLAVPQGWDTVSSDQLGDAFDDDALRQLYPKATEQERDMIGQLFASGALLMAVDPDPAGGGRNINIVSQPVEIPLGGMEKIAQAQFDQLGLDATVTDSHRVDTPAGEALRIAYTATTLGRTFDGVQFYVPTRGRTYVVTGSFDVAVADQAIATLHLGTAPEAS